MTGGQCSHVAATEEKALFTLHTACLHWGPGTIMGQQLPQVLPVSTSEETLTVGEQMQEVMTLSLTQQSKQVIRKPL